MRVQTYAFNERGELMHCGTQKLNPKRFRPSTVRRLARQWRKWALTAVPADCPTGVAARTQKQTTYRIDWPDGSVDYPI